jgi:hypothetical protein
MTDLDTLAALAEAALPKNAPKAERVNKWKDAIAVPLDTETAFMWAASPATILALIARVRAAEAALDVERIAEALGDLLNLPGRMPCSDPNCTDLHLGYCPTELAELAAALRERLLEAASLQSSAANEGKP